MACLKEIFDEHAGKDGDPKTLSKQELSDLLKSELQMEVSGKDVAQLQQRAVNVC